MNLNTVGILQCFIIATLSELGGIKKKPGCDALPNVGIIFILINAEVLISGVDFDSFAKTFELFLDIPGPPHRSYLNEVFKAPLNGIVGVLPLVKDIEQGKVVAPEPKKILLGTVSMQRFILWTIEYRIVHRKHGADH